MSQWHVLDLGGDPTPGDPDRTRALADRLVDQAELVERNTSRLRSVADGSDGLHMAGAYAPKFREMLRELPDELAKLGRAYRCCGAALSEFASRLADAKSQTSAAVRQGQEAQHTIHGALRQIRAALPPDRAALVSDRRVPHEVLIDAATADLDENTKARARAALRRAQYAEQDRQRARRLAVEATRSRSHAEAQCVQDIQAAFDDSWIKNKQWWKTAWSVVLAALLDLSGSEIPGPPEDPEIRGGSGEHGARSDDWRFVITQHAKRQLAYRMADAAELLGYTNAAAHLRHYLNNSGEDLHINPDVVMRDIDGFRTEVDMSIENEMRRIAEEAEATGRYGEPVQFSTGWAPYSASQATHPDWFFAMGTFSHSSTGVVTVYPPEEPGGQPHIEVQYRTHIYDNYNWNVEESPNVDEDEGVTIGPFPISDRDMGDMHRAGVAQEYTIRGSTETRQYVGEVPPKGQGADLDGPPDDRRSEREGDRSDPGRDRSDRGRDRDR